MNQSELRNDNGGTACTCGRPFDVLEEYARELIFQEELHVGEVDEMLRKPGDIFPDKF